MQIPDHALVDSFVQTCSEFGLDGAEQRRLWIAIVDEIDSVVAALPDPERATDEEILATCERRRVPTFRVLAQRLRAERSRKVQAESHDALAADAELAEVQAESAKGGANEDDDNEHVTAPRVVPRSTPSPQGGTAGSVYSRVQFVGLVCFVRRPGERYVLLPDGRNPGYGIDPHFATIDVAPNDIWDVTGWDAQPDISRGVFHLSPCSLAIHGVDEPGLLDTTRHDGYLPELRQIDPAFAIDLSRADTIANLHIRRGTLTAYQVPGGTAIMSQLEFSNGGNIMIAVSPSDGSATRTITLRAGAEIAIANISTPGYARAMANGTEGDSFRVYEKLGAVPVSLPAPRYVADVPVSPSRHPLFSTRVGSSTNVSNTSFG